MFRSGGVINSHVASGFGLAPRRFQIWGQFADDTTRNCVLLDYEWIIRLHSNTTADRAYQAMGRVALASLGLFPVQRLNARENAAGSEKPTR